MPKKHSFKQNFRRSFKRSVIISTIITFVAYIIITRVLGFETSGGTAKPEASVEEAARIAAITETITIGGKTWMKTNLKIWTGNSWCYDNNLDSCTKYGRKYTWHAAKKACACLGDGWRLPTYYDWEALGVDDAMLVAGVTQQSHFGRWWTATEVGGDAYMKLIGIDYSYKYQIDEYLSKKTTVYSVRCVKD